MKRFIDYILEGQVDGLKDVKVIRHYTTGAALKKILSSGVIEPHESEGDWDWRDYPIKDKKVVSFHDERTDPEYDQFIKNNNRRLSMDGYTPTLALHMKKVCACIEIDYDKLDKLVQDKAHLLNIYGKKAEHFVNLWNNRVKSIENSNEYYIFHALKVDLAELILSAYEDASGDLLNSLKHLWGRYKFEEKYTDEEAELAHKELWKLASKYYSEETLEEQIKNYYGNEVSFYVDLMSGQIGFGWSYGFPTKESCHSVIERHSKCKEFAKRERLKPFTEYEAEQLADMLVKFDFINVVKLLRKHGWRFGDSYIEGFLGKYYFKDNTIGDGSLLVWLDALMKNKKRIVNMDIEIRIASPVLLNKDNCKIKIFTGICEATKQEGLRKLPKKYYDKYNIEYIEPEN